MCSQCGSTKWRMSRKGNWTCARCNKPWEEDTPRASDTPKTPQLVPKAPTKGYARKSKAKPNSAKGAEEDSEYTYEYMRPSRTSRWKRKKNLQGPSSPQRPSVMPERLKSGTTKRCQSNHHVEAQVLTGLGGKKIWHANGRSLQMHSSQHESPKRTGPPILAKNPQCSTLKQQGQAFRGMPKETPCPHRQRNRRRARLLRHHR